MFDLSFSEIMLIGVVALIVIGPERLPKVARTIGHLVGRAQRYVSSVKSDIQREVDLGELNNIKGQMQDAAQSMRSSMQEASSSLRDPLNEAREAIGSAADAVREPATRVNATEGSSPSGSQGTSAPSASAGTSSATGGTGSGPSTPSSTPGNTP